MSGLPGTVRTLVEKARRPPRRSARCSASSARVPLEPMRDMIRERSAGVKTSVTGSECPTRNRRGILRAVPQYQHATVRSLLRRVHEGELLLPLIQRDVVWSKEQILFLLDSLLRRYPIGTLLLWRTDMEVRARRFVARYRPGMRLSDLQVPAAKERREYVLDGQQRLQGLYIALYGSYEGAEVHLDLLSRPEEASEYEMRYRLIFADPADPPTPSSIRLSELVLTDEETMPLIRRIEEMVRARGRELATEERDRLADLVSRVQNVFNQQEPLTYFEADARDQPAFADLDEVLEVFIRVNSGGTKLDTSDLLFAIVKSEWITAQEEFEEFLEELNRGGLFAFDKDDLLRVCLVLLGRGAAYDLAKLRGAPGEKLIGEIRAAWPAIRRTIAEIMDLATGRAQLQTQRVLRSKNALVPLMTYVHRARAAGGRPSENDLVAMQRWLYRVLLEREFGGQSVTLLNRCYEAIVGVDGRFPEVELLRTLRLPLQLRNDAIIDRGRGTTQESVLPVYVAYLEAGLATPAFAVRYSGNLPEVDHIVPRSWLRKRYAQRGIEPPDQLINNVGNYRLLERDENREKSDRLPDDFYTEPEARERFRRRHFIPEGTSLGPDLSLDDYEAFVAARRAVLFGRIASLLSVPGADVDASEPARTGELWTEEETVLAYDLLRQYGRIPPDSELERLARELDRKVGAVGRKMGNLIAAESGGKSGLSERSHIDDEVAARYSGDRAGLRERAAEIRAQRRSVPAT